jgi:hypothetical protein
VAPWLPIICVLRLWTCWDGKQMLSSEEPLILQLQPNNLQLPFAKRLSESFLAKHLGENSKQVFPPPAFKCTHVNHRRGRESRRAYSSSSPPSFFMPSPSPFSASSPSASALTVFLVGDFLVGDLRFLVGDSPSASSSSFLVRFLELDLGVLGTLAASQSQCQRRGQQRRG